MLVATGAPTPESAADELPPICAQPLNGSVLRHLGYVNHPTIQLASGGGYMRLFVDVVRKQVRYGERMAGRQHATEPIGTVYR